MSDIRCEICGRPPFVHLTQIVDGVTRQSAYCREHVPSESGFPLPSPSDEVRIVEQLIAQAESQEMDPAQKAEVLKELRTLAEDIAAGRRRLGDDSDEG